MDSNRTRIAESSLKKMIHRRRCSTNVLQQPLIFFHISFPFKLEMLSRRRSDQFGIEEVVGYLCRFYLLPDETIWMLVTVRVDAYNCKGRSRGEREVGGRGLRFGVWWGWSE